MATIDVPAEARRFTGDEVLRMVEVGILGEDEKVELLDGMLWVVTPQGCDHSVAVTTLTMALVRACPEGAVVRPQCPLVAGEHNLPEPDLAVLSRHEVDIERAVGRHPKAGDALLLVEIADTRGRDAQRKSRIYAAAGAPRYWLVDIRTRYVDVFTVPYPDGTWGQAMRLAGDDALELPWPGKHLVVDAIMPAERAA